jgi:hypothetical protein
VVSDVCLLFLEGRCIRQSLVIQGRTLPACMFCSRSRLCEVWVPAEWPAPM